MPKQTIFIGNPSKLSVKQGSLIVEKSNVTAMIPLEDIWVLVIESREVLITARALAELCDAGIGTMLCGKTHMPSGLLLPIGAHSRHAAIVEDQLLMSKPLKKRLWQAIVKQKILNQSKVLSFMGSSKDEYLTQLASSVLSDDSTGREAVAASLYFKEISPDGGRRNSNITAFLDYGYAVLRAGIARYAVAGGWLVSRGIHHDNNLNAFNLVDDFIEPFRPVVDLLVLQEIETSKLDTTAKQKLASIFSYYVKMGGAKYTVQSAIEEMLDSFKHAVLEDDSSKLLLPEIIPLEQWSGEEK